MGNIPAKISGKYQSYDINTATQLTPSITLNTSRKESNTSSLQMKQNYNNSIKKKFINESSMPQTSQQDAMKSLGTEQRTSYLLSQSIDVPDKNVEHEEDDVMSEKQHHETEEYEQELDNANRENFQIFDKNNIQQQQQINTTKKIYSNLDDSLSESHHEETTNSNSHQNQDDDDEEEEEIIEGKSYLIIIIVI